MLIAFIIIVLGGLAAFAFIFMKALKGIDAGRAGTLRPFQADPVTPTVTAPLELSADQPSQIVELKAICQASEMKIRKLELMIGEKNKSIADLKENVRSGQDHGNDIEGLKQILQTQIEELKAQNKSLKSEISRLSQENLDLQTRVYAGEPSRAAAEQPIQIHPVSSTSPSPGSLSLHDVFGEEKTS